MKRFSEVTIMMRKIMTALLAVLLLVGQVLPGFGAGAAETQVLPRSGLTLTAPAVLSDTKGQVVYTGEMELIPGITYAYWYYCAVPEDKVTELFRNESDFTRYATPLFMTFSIGKGLKFKDMNDLIGNTLDPEQAMEIGKLGAMTHYLYFGPADQSFAQGLEAEYAQEYTALTEKAQEVAAGFSFQEPVTEYSSVIGTKVEFETVDLNGKKVNSADLFGKNEVTMLNIWATWCGPCVQELPELQALHKRLQLKGCGVVGLMADTDLNSAKKLVGQNEITYPIILAPANFYSLLPIEGYPTTFFVDREGRILDVLVGAYVTLYEPAMEGLLEVVQQAAEKAL